MDKSSSVTLSKSRSTVVAGNTTNVGVDASRMKQPWLNAWRDPVAGVKAFPQCIRLSDIYGDGDHRLVIGDTEKTLVIYQGANIDKKYPLTDSPTAVVTFYAEQSKIRMNSPFFLCFIRFSIYINSATMHCSGHRLKCPNIKKFQRNFQIRSSANSLERKRSGSMVQLSERS